MLRTAAGTVAATYTYDAWGKVISYSGTMAGTNPLRYRGYYCDTETGFYYLQSRYYDPELHRFINADSLASTGQGFLGTNMFAYCLNNPIIGADPAGCFVEILADGGMKLLECKPSPHFDYINDQEAPGIGELPLGLATVGHGGCGVVATYNALVSMGDYTPFLEVLSYYDDIFKLNAAGYIGMMPSAVINYFKNHGYLVEAVVYEYDLYMMSNIADATILWYAYDTSSFPYIGAHFVAVGRDGKNFVAHNTYSGMTKFDSLPEFAYQNSRILAIGIFIFKQED